MLVLAEPSNNKKTPKEQGTEELTQQGPNPKTYNSMQYEAQGNQTVNKDGGRYANSVPTVSKFI